MTFRETICSRDKDASKLKVVQEDLLDNYCHGAIHQPKTYKGRTGRGVETHRWREHLLLVSSLSLSVIAYTHSRYRQSRRWVSLIDVSLNTIPT